MLGFLGRIVWGGGGGGGSVGFVINGFGKSPILPLALSTKNGGRLDAVFSDCVVDIVGVGVTRNWRPGDGVLGSGGLTARPGLG